MILLDFLPVKRDKSSLIAKVGFSFLFSFSPHPCTLDGFEFIHLGQKPVNQCLLKKHTNRLNWKILRIVKLAPISTGKRRGQIESVTIVTHWKLWRCFSGQLKPGWEMSSTEPFWAQLQPSLMQVVLNCSHSFPSWWGLVGAWIMKCYVISELYKCRLPL